MNSGKIPPAKYITTDTSLKRLVSNLADEPLLAVDTESNSLYAYQEQVCLIQVSTRTADFIIDPMAIQDLEPFGSLLANPKIEKIFHAAEYDLICLKRDYDFTIHNLFDTMIAARVCGHKNIGLGSLLSEYIGVDLDKKHQRDNWGHRPLPKASLRYAQMDTHFLPALRDHIYDQLVKLNRLEEARENFDETCQVTVSAGRQFDPEGYWAIGLPHKLTRRQMSILRELYLLREELAQRRDRPPFKVFTNKTLVTLAQAEPETLLDLKPLNGMTTSQRRRYGKRILEAVRKGAEGKVSYPPRHRPPDPAVTERYTAFHLWRKARAEERGVESDVIISKHALWQLAQKMPTSLDAMAEIDGLGPWRIETYGRELLDMIDQFKNGSS